MSKELAIRFIANREATVTLFKTKSRLEVLKPKPSQPIDAKLRIAVSVLLLNAQDARTKVVKGEHPKASSAPQGKEKRKSEDLARVPRQNERASGGCLLSEVVSAEIFLRPQSPLRQGVERLNPHPSRLTSVGSYQVDPACSHMLVSKTKPCTSQYKLS